MNATFYDELVTALTSSSLPANLDGESFDPDRHVIIGTVPAPVANLHVMMCDLIDTGAEKEKSLAHLTHDSDDYRSLVSELQMLVRRQEALSELTTSLLTLSFNMRKVIKTYAGMTVLADGSVAALKHEPDSPAVEGQPQDLTKHEFYREILAALSDPTIPTQSNCAEFDPDEHELIGTLPTPVCHLHNLSQKLGQRRATEKQPYIAALPGSDAELDAEVQLVTTEHQLQAAHALKWALFDAAFPEYVTNPSYAGMAIVKNWQAVMQKKTFKAGAREAEQALMMSLGNGIVGLMLRATAAQERTSTDDEDDDGNETPPSIIH